MKLSDIVTPGSEAGSSGDRPLARRAAHRKIGLPWGIPEPNDIQGSVAGAFDGAEKPSVSPDENYQQSVQNLETCFTVQTVRAEG